MDDPWDGQTDKQRYRAMVIKNRVRKKKDI